MRGPQYLKILATKCLDESVRGPFQHASLEGEWLLERGYAPLVSPRLGRGKLDASGALSACATLTILTYGSPRCIGQIANYEGLCE